MKRLVRLAGSLVLLGMLTWRGDLDKVAEALGQVRWGWWLAGVGCYFFAQLLSAVRWQWLSEPLGFQQRTWTYVGQVFVGNFFNCLLPTSVGGDVARAWYLGRGTGLGSRAVLSVLADRLNGLYVLVGLACLAAMVVPLPAWVKTFIVLSAAGGVVGLVLLLLPSRGRQPPVAALGWRRRWYEMATALDFYRRSPRLLGSVTLLSLLVQLLNVVMVWSLAGAAGASVRLSFCCVLMPVVTLLTLAPISVNGMGVREGATLLLLEPLGVPHAQAITLALLWFSVFVTAGLTGGVCVATGRLPRCEGNADAERVCGHPDQGRAGQSATAA